MGDVFDFWFDYKTVVPTGYTRLLGQLADFSDEGIPVFYFTGNHDMWVFDYFEKELGFKIFRKPIELQLGQLNCLIGHGDGLGPGDKNYKRLKKVFQNKICQFLFRWIHPDIGIRIARTWSMHGNRQYLGHVERFLGENEWLVQYARQKLREKHYDYFIFGHRHIPINYPLNNKSNYINLGDWINHFTYAKYNGETIELLQYE